MNYKLKNLYIMKLTITVATLFLIFNVVVSQEVNQWRGTERTGIFPEKDLLKTWPEAGPELLWSLENLPKGYASMSSSDGIIYTTGLVDSTDVCIAVDITGKIKWQTAYGLAWNQSFPESRCTPTIDGNNLYVSSGLGEIACIDKNSGSIIWRINAKEKFEGKCGDWGYAESLIVFDDKVYFTPAGKKTTIVALNKNNGKTIWQSESLDDYTAYVSPLLVKIGNKDVIINVLANNLVGIDAENGKILFCKDYASISNEKSVSFWEGGPFTNTNTPLYENYHIYVTSGYDHVGVMFKISEGLSNLSVKWIDETLDVHHGGIVKVGQYIYGANWVNNSTGNWCCIDWKTGEKKWDQKWHSKGSIISADGMLYIYDEKQGNVGLLEPNPEEFNLISSFKIPPGKGPHWSHPVIYKGILYIRHTDVLMAFDIKLK